MVMNPETRAVGVWSWVHDSWCRQTGMHVTWHPVVRRWGGMRWIAVARDPKFPPSRVKQPTAVECWAFAGQSAKPRHWFAAAVRLAWQAIFGQFVDIWILMAECDVPKGLLFPGRGTSHGRGRVANAGP